LSSNKNKKHKENTILEEAKVAFKRGKKEKE
jgi:hypothetical protein